MAVEGLAVEQAGELVVGRLVGELERHQALVRDVLEDQHGADDLAVVGADRGAGALDRVAPPVAPLEGDPLGEAEALPLLEAVAQQRRDVLALPPCPLRWKISGSGRPRAVPRSQPVSFSATGFRYLTHP